MGVYLQKYVDEEKFQFLLCFPVSFRSCCAILMLGFFLYLFVDQQFSVCILRYFSPNNYAFSSNGYAVFFPIFFRFDCAVFML